MDRRKEPRHAATDPAVLFLLGDTEASWPVTVQNRSPNGMAILSDRPIPLAVPLRIDCNGQMFLGEACYCSLTGSAFLVGVKLEHVIADVQALANLSRALWDELGGGGDHAGVLLDDECSYAMEQRGNEHKEKKEK